MVGPRHEDSEFIGFKKFHRHFDLRFITNEQMDFLCTRGVHIREYDRLRGILNLADSDAHARVWTGEKEPELIEMMCQREQPDYSIPNHGTNPHWIEKISDHLKDAKIKCGKCPHKGLPLLNLPRISGTNVVQCRGHGVCWDLDTGKIVR